jgi:xanthine dehydrogenase accessory factor
MRLDILAQLNAERAARRGAIVVTNAETGAQRLVRAAEVKTDPLHDILEARLRSGKSGPADSPEGRVFLSVHVPPTRLVITGAVHISQALAPIARILGYDVTIVDPRTAFATKERFPDVPVIAEWPDTALPPLNVDRYTAFVALTTRKSTTRRCCTRLPASVFTSARSARRKRTDGASTASKRRA